MTEWTCSWSMAGVWLVKTGPSLSDQLSFAGTEMEKARLIAAAPDLLEALQLILPLAKGYAPAGQTVTAKRTCNSWIEAAEAALAKTKGLEQQ